MNPLHYYMIFVCAVVALTFVFGSIWRGLCYAIWGCVVLAFWWALCIVVGLIPWPL